MCGNGVVEPENGELCDDGDLVDNNGCSNACAPVPCEEQEDAFAQLLGYIWIANSSQNTVSKINTETALEVGRYYVEGGSPSRTTVNLQGDVAVSSRDPGGVTKIAAQLADCVDANNNGLIETSSGPNDILPLGTDECVLWRKAIASPGFSYGPRATAWVAGTPDPESCEYPDPVLWVGWKDNRDIAHFLKIEGATGETLASIEHPWGAEFSPYGGAVDADGNFYATGLNDMPSVKVDFETHEVTDLGNPTGCKYGMTLDLAGVVWSGTCSGEGVYYRDPESEAWTTLAGPGGGRVNGVMADAEGNVAGSNPCRLVHIDAETKTYVDNSIPLPGCINPWGVSIDYQGYVWVVDMSANRAFKIDPDSYQVVAEVSGLVNPYTYSDMTGSLLRLVADPLG
jgi:cysteine-rich repeat protein